MILDGLGSNLVLEGLGSLEEFLVINNIKNYVVFTSNHKKNIFKSEMD